MKKLLIILLILIIGCNRYEPIDKSTRMNKWSGEVETLEADGEWYSKKDKAKKLKKIATEKKRKKELLRASWDIVPRQFLNDDLVHTTLSWDGESYSKPKINVTNDTDWKLHEARIYINIKKKGTDEVLIERYFDCKADYSYGIAPHSKEEMTCGYPEAGITDEQEWTWSIEDMWGERP